MPVEKRNYTHRLLELSQAHGSIPRLKSVACSAACSRLTLARLCCKSISFIHFKIKTMAIRKNSSDPLEERSSNASNDISRINDEDNLDTREISNEVEEGDEDYDDEELDDELDEDDFEIDEEDDEEDEEVR